jgi:hypothetical protein
MENPNQSQFWDKYIGKTKLYNIKPAVARWYVRHAENYIKAQENSRLFEHTAIQIESYLSDKGRRAGRHYQESDLPRFTPFLRDASIGKWLRYSHSARALRAC